MRSPAPTASGRRVASTPLRARSLRPAVLALTGLGAVYLVWTVFGDSRAALARVAPTRLPLYLGVVLVVIVLRALRWRIVLDRLGIGLGLARLARLWLAGRAVGSLIPSGTLAGEPVRAELLRSSGATSATAAGAVALDRSLEFVGNMIAGPACIGTALLLGTGSRAGTLLATAGALAGIAIFAFVYLRSAQRRPALVTLVMLAGLDHTRWLRALRRHAARADEALQHLIAAHPGLVPAGIGLSLAIECLQLGELAALFALFGLAVPLPLFLLSSVGIGVARVVPVTAALGSLEATQVGIFALGGHTLALGLTVGLALRLAETLWILAGLACLAAETAARAPVRERDGNDPA
jgi:uncharacterized protein (TIRG00374 family)